MQSFCTWIRVHPVIVSAVRRALANVAEQSAGAAGGFTHAGGAVLAMFWPVLDLACTCYVAVLNMEAVLWFMLYLAHHFTAGLASTMAAGRGQLATQPRQTGKAGWLHTGGVQML